MHPIDSAADTAALLMAVPLVAWVLVAFAMALCCSWPWMVRARGAARTPDRRAAVIRGVLSMTRADSIRAQDLAHKIRDEIIGGSAPYW
ncbi:MAG: hypothetical protein LC798_02925, partial [Chloroflexi bacterium]|nr:hypothetical protein [Chloroflexota bacterium]